MLLITATEVSQIAFVNSLDPALILPIFISSAETKYIVPLVTTVLITQINATPGDYTTLVNDYIKPYEAFCIKYMFYNQLLTETDTFPTSDQQRSAALQEVLSIMEVSRDQLAAYLNAEIFETPTTSKAPVISGFRTSSALTSTSTPSSSDVTATLNSASSGIPSDADTFNFVNFATGLLNKVTWANIKAALKSYFDIVYASFIEADIPFEFQNITPGTAQTYILDIKASINYTILAAILQTDTGTLTGVSVKIQSTAVTSLSSVTVNNTLTETASTGSRNVIPGNQVSISTSTGFTGTPTTLRGKLKISRS